MFGLSLIGAPMQANVPGGTHNNVVPPGVSF
jgi:hypothetical protein